MSDDGEQGAVLTVFFDLGRIATLGAIFFVMDAVLHWGALRRLAVCSSYSSGRGRSCAGVARRHEGLPGREA